MTPEGLDFDVENNSDANAAGVSPIVLPSSGANAMNVLALTNQRVEEWAKDKEAKKAVKSAQLGAMLKGLNVDPKNVLDKDVPYFVQGKQALEDFNTKLMVNGINGDNPRDMEAFAQNKKMKDELETYVQASSLAKTNILNAQKALDEDGRYGKPEMFDHGASMKAIADYHDMDLKDRSKKDFQLLVPKKFNADTYLREKIFNKNGPFKPEKSADLVEQGNFSFIKEAEDRTPAKVMDGIRYAIDNNQDFKDDVYSKFNALTPEARQKLIDHAQVATNNGTPMTGEELFAAGAAEYAYEESGKPFEYHSEVYKQKSADPFKLASYKVALKNSVQQQAVEPYVKKWASLFSGDATRWNKFPDGSLHSPSFVGDPIGEPVVNELGVKIPNEIQDIKFGGKDANGNNILLLKTVRSSQEFQAGRNKSEYYPVSEMSDAMYPWIAANHVKSKVPELIQATQTVGVKNKIYDASAGKFVIPQSPNQNYSNQDLAIAKQRLPQVETALVDVQAKLDKLKGTAKSNQPTADALIVEQKKLVAEKGELIKKIGLNASAPKKYTHSATGADGKKIYSNDGKTWVDGSGNAIK